MIPNNPVAQEEYSEMREFRNRMRDMQMKSLGGDVEVFTDYLYEKLSENANIASFREIVDYMNEMGYPITEDMKHAAENMISWGEELIKMIKESK